MKELIQALEIFVKYGNPHSPTHCEHDILLVMINPNTVSDEDKEKLDALGFFVGEEYPDYFSSFRFGSA